MSCSGNVHHMTGIYLGKSRWECLHGTREAVGKSCKIRVKIDVCKCVSCSGNVRMTGIYLGRGRWECLHGTREAVGKSCKIRVKIDVCKCVLCSGKMK